MVEVIRAGQNYLTSQSWSPVGDQTLLGSSYTSVTSNNALAVPSGNVLTLPVDAVLELIPDLGWDALGLDNTNLTRDLYMPSNSSQLVIGPYIIGSGSVLAIGSGAAFGIL